MSVTSKSDPRSEEVLFPYPEGLIGACEESWLDGPLGVRKSQRLAQLTRLEQTTDRAALDGLVDATMGEVDDYRLVDVRLPIVPTIDGHTPNRRDGFVLRYRNDSATWSGEYYVRSDVVRVSVALDEGDIDRLVAYHVAGHDAEDVGGGPGDSDTGHICFPRR